MVEDKKFVPVVKQLHEIYGKNYTLLKKQEERYYNTMKRFESLYGEAPQFFVRAPGRVNIIGEHIDYCGYSVLPAALDQDFIMAYAPHDKPQIILQNVDKDQWPREEIDIDPHQKFRDGAHWVNYFLCGYKAIFALESKFKGTDKKDLKGFKVLIDSQVPPASGLSSSSAFCVCAAITTMHANGLMKEFDQATLAELVIAAERLAGTACGGMDQTISIMGQLNTAKLIDFVPKLKATDIKIPDNVQLVIANSLTPSAKLQTLGTRYNKRVVECRFSVAVIALHKGLVPSLMECKIKTFQELQEKMGLSFQEMIQEVKKCLKPEGYTIQMLRRATNHETPFDYVSDVSHVDEVESKNAAFYLYERAIHVFSEAERVHEFRRICEDDTLEPTAKVNKLGQLMNESHQSCDKLYDCSSEELNELTQKARDAGALGSRLTGAGWGGCCVSLVFKADCQAFVDKMMGYYTDERPAHKKLWVTDDLERYIFASSPGQGALVLDPEFCDFYL